MPRFPNRHPSRLTDGCLFVNHLSEKKKDARRPVRFAQTFRHKGGLFLSGIHASLVSDFLS
jgi:hypothetical protein